MKQWIRRLTVMLLAVCMCMSFACAEVWAAESETEQSDESAVVVSEEEAEAPEAEEDSAEAAESETPDDEAAGQTGEASESEEGKDDDGSAADSASEKPEGFEPQEELAAQEVASGTCGDNLTWMLDESGTLTINGTGRMENSSSWNDYCETIKKVSVLSGVTSIGDDAFNGCSSLKSITLPSGVTSIGEDAFYECSSLTSINIPSSVTSIGYEAFYGCSSLTSIIIPSGVTSISEATFRHCARLTSVSIPSGVTSIGEEAFYDCSSLTSITIPSSVTSIEEDAFCGCDSLKSIKIPSSVTSIGEYAFYFCTELKKIEFEGNAPQIAENTFSVVTATAYYPAGNKTWTKEKRKQYGGEIKWYIPLKVSLKSVTYNYYYQGWIRVTWKAVRGISGYELEVSESKNFKTGKQKKHSVPWPDMTDVTLTYGLKLGKTYYVRVRPYEENGAEKSYGVWSAVKSVKVKLPEVTMKSLSSPQKGWIKLTWKVAKEISGYQLQVSESKDFKTGKQKKSNLSAKEKDVTMSGLKSKKTYYARLRTYKKSGSKTYYGEWSKAKAVKVK